MAPLHCLMEFGEAGAADEDFLGGNIAFYYSAEAFGYGHGIKWVDSEKLGRIDVFLLMLFFFSCIILVNCNVFNEVTIESPSHKSPTSSIHSMSLPTWSTHTAPPMSIPANSSAQIVTSRHGPFLPQTSGNATLEAKSNVRSTYPTCQTSFNQASFEFRVPSSNCPHRRDLPAVSLVRRASSPLGPCYTSTRSHLEKMRLSVWRRSGALALQPQGRGQGHCFGVLVGGRGYLRVDEYVYIRRFVLSRFPSSFLSFSLSPSSPHAYHDEEMIEMMVVMTTC
jgi:hypothetical protein